ncbi:MAG: aspartate/glutamate racemase family protein [Chloroflexota bacterium]
MATVGVIRVLTTEDPQLLAAHGRILEQDFGLTAVNRCIPDQPNGIYNDETERIAVPKVIRLGRELANEGVDAIVVSCAADPGVTELRAELKIPVIGAGSSVSAVALGLAERIGILNLTEGAPGPVRRLLGDRFVGEASPEGVRNTLDLMTGWGRDAALESAHRFVEAGAGALVLACTGYATIGMADLLRTRVGILAIDPVRAAGLITSYAVRRHASLS